MRLKAKTVIVTGAAQGMGAATVQRLAKEGAHVILTDINVEGGQKFADSVGAQFAPLNVTKEEEWASLVDAIVKDRGGIDGLVNNAGIYFSSLIEDTKVDALRSLLDIDLIGPWLGMRAVVPHMKQARRGSIVNIASVEGKTGFCGGTAYAAAKWGLQGMTKSVAKEVGPFGVRVNSINPGVIETPLLPPGMAGPEFASLFPGVALNRIGQPEEIAAVSLFLLSDDASYISGADITADGGWMCGEYLHNKPESD